MIPPYYVYMVIDSLLLISIPSFNQLTLHYRSISIHIYYHTIAIPFIHPDDHLYLLTVCDDLKPLAMHSYWGLDIPTDIYSDAQDKAKKEARELLRIYGHICLERHIDCHLLLGVSDHIGEMITQAVDKKHIDILVMGRRGMGKIKRIFMGSVSKYCVEHANCNVLVVKNDPSILERHQQQATAATTATVEEREKVQEQERLKRLDELHHKMETMQVNYDEESSKKEA